MNQRREINEMQQYKASNRAEKMIIQMGKDLIKGTKEVKKEIVKVEKEMNKVCSLLSVRRALDFVLTLMTAHHDSESPDSSVSSLSDRTDI